MTFLSPDELETELRAIGAQRYHHLHPFHRVLHGGGCSKGQVQAWALNRYCYQAIIPRKDAMLIARCDDPDLRRAWRTRLVDHDGEGHDDGGLARWLKLTDGLGLDRDYVISQDGALPATRFAAEPIFISCRNARCSKRSPHRSPSCSRRRSFPSGSRAC